MREHAPDHGTTNLLFSGNRVFICSVHVARQFYGEEADQGAESGIADAVDGDAAGNEEEGVRDEGGRALRGRKEVWESCQKTGP